jgi:hypothetical protein
MLAFGLLLPMWGGAQTRPPADWNSKELKEAVSSAKSADDHARIADYYAAQAERLEEEAKAQVALAERLRRSPNEFLESKHPMSPGTAGHAEWLASRYHALAEKNRQFEEQQRRQMLAAPR